MPSPGHNSAAGASASPHARPRRPATRTSRGASVTPSPRRGAPPA
jgi:hypothetical protein